MSLRRLISLLVDAPFSHREKCERKLRRLVAERGSRLENRGLTRENAQKQAQNELIQFVELMDLDADWIPDIGVAEDHFLLFTKSLDANLKVTAASVARFARGSRRRN